MTIMYNHYLCSTSKVSGINWNLKVKTALALTFYSLILIQESATVLNFLKA